MAGKIVLDATGERKALRSIRTFSRALRADRGEAAGAREAGESRFLPEPDVG
jgi:hypothetical protein